MQGPVTTYFFIFVKVMGALSNDLRSYFESFLIFVAKRFNTAYDLLLIPDSWSGGETSSWLTFVGCSGKSAKLSDSEYSRGDGLSLPGTEESFLFWN